MNENEEFFIGGYILRRTMDETFLIENTMTGEGVEFDEEKFTALLDKLWEDGPEAA